MPSNVFRSLEAGDDPAFQTDHVDSVLAIIAGQKQVLELGAGLRSPLPAAELIDEKLAANVPIDLQQLLIDLVFFKGHKLAKFMQYVVQRREGSID